MNQTYERQFKQDLHSAVAAMQPNYMVTMNYRRPLPGSAETRRRTVVTHFREWNRQVLEALFGRKFSKRNQADAYLGVAFIEVGPLLLKEHMHVLVRVPEDLQPRFEAKAGALWLPKEIAPAAGRERTAIESDILVRRIHDVDGAVRYCAKDVRVRSDNIVFSNEFRITAG